MAKEYAIDETFRQGKVNLKVCEGPLLAQTPSTRKT